MFPIYDKLGGPQAVLDIIERRLSWRPSSHTLKKWAANRRISAKASVALIAECEQSGVAVSIEDFKQPTARSAFAGERPTTRRRA
jgi:hypothetical protein